jgi:hypothetical protein
MIISVAILAQEAARQLLSYSVGRWPPSLLVQTFSTEIMPLSKMAKRERLRKKTAAQPVMKTKPTLAKNREALDFRVKRI